MTRRIAQRRQVRDDVLRDALAEVVVRAAGVERLLNGSTATELRRHTAPAFPRALPDARTSRRRGGHRAKCQHHARRQCRQPPARPVSSRRIRRTRSLQIRSHPSTRLASRAPRPASVSMSPALAGRAAGSAAVAVIDGPGRTWQNRGEDRAAAAMRSALVTFFKFGDESPRRSGTRPLTRKNSSTPRL